MNKRTSLLFCGLLFSVGSFGGTPRKVRFVYDQAGNRIHRILSVDSTKNQHLRSASWDSLRPLDSWSLLSSGSDEQECIDIRLYPNPTNGYLTLTIQEWKAGDIGSVAVYDLQGHLLLVRSLTEARMELDLTSQAPGIYLLRLQVGVMRFTRKIYKR